MKRKIVEYTILYGIGGTCGSAIDDLVTKVNNHIEMGWILRGKIVKITVDKNMRPAQVMVKKNKF